MNSLIINWEIIYTDTVTYSGTKTFSINFLCSYCLNGFLYENNSSENWTIQGYNVSSFNWTRSSSQKTIRWAAIGY